MVCTCGDATVRLISPGSGACVTSLLVPGMNTINDVVCAAAESKFLVLFYTYILWLKLYGLMWHF
jgi:hypothetical protein